jgi:hypothetical protein
MVPGTERALDIYLTNECTNDCNDYLTSGPESSMQSLRAVVHLPTKQKQALCLSFPPPLTYSCSWGVHFSSISRFSASPAYNMQLTDMALVDPSLSPSLPLAFASTYY